MLLRSSINFQTDPLPGFGFIAAETAASRTAGDSPGEPACAAGNGRAFEAERIQSGNAPYVPERDAPVAPADWAGARRRSRTPATEAIPALLSRTSAPDRKHAAQPDECPEVLLRAGIAPGEILLGDSETEKATFASPVIQPGRGSGYSKGYEQRKAQVDAHAVLRGRLAGKRGSPPSGL